MLLVRGFHYRLILLLISAGIFLVVLRPASAQLSKQEKQHIATTLAAEINRAITTKQTDGIVLRERVVARLIQCGKLFIMMSKANAPEAKTEAKNLMRDIGEISFNLSALVSGGIAVDRFNEIADAASDVMKGKFAAARTPDSEREMDMLLWNCKSFHKIAEIPGAVAALLQPRPVYIPVAF
jgi:hypothetical protein